MSLELWDWRRRVGDLYAMVRAEDGGEAAWQRWRTGRDDLFAGHPQSPLAPDRTLDWFPYDPRWRLEAELMAAPGEPEVWRSDEATFERIGSLVFDPPGAEERSALAVWWLDGYAGGVFVPFRDATAGVSTYGGGRYLLDTAKGADLGHRGTTVVLDFNFAYHPSCAHDPRWPCPLAPAANRLAFAVEAGERLVLAP